MVVLTERSNADAFKARQGIAGSPLTDHNHCQWFLKKIAMSENVRKRVSKWDLASDTHFPFETGQVDVQPAIAGETSGDESKMDLKSFEDAGSEFLKWPSAEENKNYSKWSDLEAENVTILSSGTDGSHVSKWSDIRTSTKDCPKESNQEPASRRDEWGDINVNQESGSLVTSHGQCYDHNISPNTDARRQQNHSFSPKGGWNRSRSQSRSRSRSRSRSVSRSRSQSRSRSRDYDGENRNRGGEWGWGRRSRSRSPVHGFKRGNDGWGEKRQMGSGAPCRDFVAGRCKRGGECRYLHEDGSRRFSTRHHDAVEFGESRNDRGQSPGYHSKEQTNDSMGKRDYPHERVARGHPSHYGGDWQKPELHKSGKDNAICHDFRRGRCQRGSACKYIHHNASSDGGWEVKGQPRDRLQDGSDVKESLRPDRRPEFCRASDTPCKFFAEGRCRNGDKCRFSHQVVVQSQPDGRSGDFKSVQSSDSENRMRWNGPTWDSQESSMTSPNAPGWQRDDRNSIAAPCATVGLESGPDLHGQQSKYAEADKKYMAIPMDVSQTALLTQVQSSSQETSSQHQHVSKFSAQPALQNVFAQQPAGGDGGDGSPRDSDSIVINTSISRNETSRLPCKDEALPINNSISQNEQNLVNNLPANPASTGQSSNLIEQNQYLIPQPSNAQSCNLAGQSQQVVTPPPFNGQGQQPLVCSLPMNGQTRLIVPQAAPNIQGFNISNQSHQIPPPSFNGPSHQISHSLPSSQQSQFIAPQPPQNLNCTMETESQQKHTLSMDLDNQAHVGQEGQLQRADNVVTKSSQTTSDTVPQRSGVTQLSNLSASLAQIFGNGPQLPQLYAALNPYHDTGVSHTFSHPGSVGSLVSTTATYVQPNQGSWTQPQHVPVSDIRDLGKVDISNMSPGLPLDPIEQRSMTIGEPQAPLKMTTPLQSTDGTIRMTTPLQSTDGPIRTIDSETKRETKQVDANGDNKLKEKGTVAGLSDKEQPTAHSEDPNSNIQTDEASKRNKDGKGTRLFRFALVEFVKDILRPTWKEGQMSKEAHKTIVKKVVDKVIVTLDNNIPQTQERIDLYLSYSKEKLTKLVQAYIEKYLKT